MADVNEQIQQIIESFRPLWDAVKEVRLMADRQNFERFDTMLHVAVKTWGIEQIEKALQSIKEESEAEIDDDEPDQYKGDE